MSRNPKQLQHFTENGRNKHCSNHIQGCHVCQQCYTVSDSYHLLCINQIPDDIYWSSR